MNNPNYLFQQAVQLHNAGHLVDAVMAYHLALAQQPQHAQALYNLALALQKLNRTDEAIANYQRAIIVDPSLVQAYNNLGNIFQHQKKLNQAQQAYELALAINPALPQAQFNLGLVLKKQNQFGQAVEHFLAALKLVPDYTEALDNLCSLSMILGRTDEWLEAFRKYEKVANKAAWPFVSSLSACRNLGDFSLEQRSLEILYAHPFKDDDIDMLDGILSTVQYFDIPQAQLLRLYQAYNHAVKLQHFAEFPLVSPYRPQRTKLRIGYLSADFRVHVMGKLMFEVLSRHDRSQFEIYLYSLSPKEDALTARFRSISDKFIGLHDLPARQAAKMIAENDLDILIDLCNHTTDSNPLILAYKPARVQITHLGAHGAIGIDTVDYKLTDHYADVPGNSAYLIEKLLPMEGCLFPFRHVEPSVDKRFSRAALGINEKALVLGVFVNIMKLSPRCLKTWAAIMSRVEHAVLVFSPFKGAEQASYLRQTSAVGIDPVRVVFIPAPKDEHLSRARYTLVDIALDTFPYSGGDTTLAALDMGVPVVTLCGQRHSERTSYSILMNLGVPETIAHSEAEFVEVACRLAIDTVWRRAVVENIRRGLADSPLADMDAYTRHLEDVYHRAIAQCSLKEQTGNDDSQAMFQEAVRQHQATRLTEAAECYLQVLAKQPDHATALYLYGRLLEQTGRDIEAVEHLKRAVAASPVYFAAHLALGNMHLKLEHMEDAYTSFNRALQLKPGHFDALNGLGQTLCRAGRLREAISILQQAVKNYPDQSAAYFNLGVTYHKQGDLTAAEAAYRRALLLDPNDTDIQSNLDLLMRERKHPVPLRAKLNGK